MQLLFLELVDFCWGSTVAVTGRFDQAKMEIWPRNGERPRIKHQWFFCLFFFCWTWKKIRLVNYHNSARYIANVGNNTGYMYIYNIYIYMYMRIYMCIYVYICDYMWLYVIICVYICISINISINIYVHMCTYMYVYIYMYICIYVYISDYMWLYVYICIYI